MSPEILAILGCLCYAFSIMFIRLGVRTTSVMAGLVVSLVAGTAVTLVATLLNLPERIDQDALIIYALSGLLGPGLARGASIVAIESLGAARTTPLMSSLYPIFGVAYALIALNETAGIERIVGLGIVVLGVWMLSKKEATVVADPMTPVSDDAIGRIQSRIPAIAFPFAAGILYGVSDAIRKPAVDVLPNAALGGLIGMLAALIVWTAAVWSSGQIKSRLRFSGDSWWFGLSGASSALALLFVNRAFEGGDASVVIPIVAAQPLPVLLLSAFFLRRADTIDLNVVVATICVVAGTILISTT